jgi:NAD-dependent deacetylase
MDIKGKMELERLITASSRIVFFGGAGVSTESGIPDFRSAQGLYRDNNIRKDYPHTAEVMLSHAFFIENPDLFFQFYRSVILHPQARPNPAHMRLAQLEQTGQLIAVITQNIDGLHQLAGSHHVLELHGSVHRNNCMQCGKTYDLSVVTSTRQIPMCSCGGMIKPDVVLYGESLDNSVLFRAIAALQQADLLIIGGTSLTVYPAAGLIDYFRNGKIILINQNKTALNHRADLVIRAPIGLALANTNL